MRGADRSHRRDRVGYPCSVQAMSMSDCPECWQTPCCCGHEWRKMELVYLRVHKAMIEQVIREKEQGIDALPTAKLHERPEIVVITDWKDGERWRMVGDTKVYRSYGDYIDD